jgi:DNA-binding CsgD family transcriptional regulator
MEARAIRGLGLSALGETEAALEEYRHLAAEAFPGAQAQRVVMARGWIDLAIGEVDAGCSELESALPTDVLGGSWRISLWAHAWLARGHFLRGRWDDALEVAERGIDLASRSGMTLLLPLLHWTTSQIHALRGDGGAEASLRRGDARPLDYSIMRVPAALAWAAEAETRGDYRSVLQALGPFAAGAFGDLVDEPGYWPWADVYANALVMEGRLAEAANFLDSREAAASLGHRAGRARLAAPRGRLLGATGDLAGAQRVFDEALDLLAGLPLEYDRARITFAYGQTLRRGGRRRDAESVLDAARRMFSALGAQTYVARCDRELGATEATGDGPLTRLLTGKERLVVDLAVRGRSNREIASDLYISEKTVQFHLTRVYAKFGVKSRTALAAVWLDDRDRTASVDPG